MSNTNVHQQPGRPGDKWSPEFGWIPAEEGFDPTATGNFVPNMQQSWNGPQPQPYAEPPIELKLSEKLQQRFEPRTVSRTRYTKGLTVTIAEIAAALVATGSVAFIGGMTVGRPVVTFGVEHLTGLHVASAQHGVAEGNGPAPKTK